MEIKPFKWGVSIVGSWNRAILTPHGIATRLLKIADGNRIDLKIEVPIDGPFALRVIYEGLLITVDEQKLTVEISEDVTPSFDLLGKAMEIGRNAIQGLPETPLLAAGFNVRYRIEQPDIALYDIIQCPMDNGISDAGFEISTRKASRGVRISNELFRLGIINILLEESTSEEFALTLNFHCDSRKNAQLAEWLRIPHSSIEDVVKAAFSAVNLSWKEIEKNE